MLVPTMSEETAAVVEMYTQTKKSTIPLAATSYKLKIEIEPVQKVP